MLAKAKHFRACGVSVGIRDFLAKQGIDINSSVIVQASEGYILGFPFGLGGIIVTADRRFFRFELELNAALTDVVLVHEFVDVTAQQNVSLRNTGTGKGFGALALAVLRSLEGA